MKIEKIKDPKSLNTTLFIIIDNEVINLYGPSIITIPDIALVMYEDYCSPKQIFKLKNKIIENKYLITKDYKSYYFTTLYEFIGLFTYV